MRHTFAIAMLLPALLLGCENKTGAKSSSSANEASSAAPAASATETQPLLSGVPDGSPWLVELPPSSEWLALLPSGQAAGIGAIVDTLLDPTLKRYGLSALDARALFKALGPSVAFAAGDGVALLTDLEDPKAFDKVLEGGAFARKRDGARVDIYSGQALVVGRFPGTNRAVMASSRAAVDVVLATLHGDKPRTREPSQLGPKDHGKLVGHIDLARVAGAAFGPGSELHGTVQAELGKGLHANLESTLLGAKVPHFAELVLPGSHSFADRLPASTTAVVSLSLRRAGKTTLADLVKALASPFATAADISEADAGLKEVTGLSLAALDAVVGDTAVIAIIDDPAQSAPATVEDGGFATRRAALVAFELRDEAKAQRAMTVLKAALERDVGGPVQAIAGGFRIDKSMMQAFFDAEVFVARGTLVVSLGAAGALAHARAELTHESAPFANVPSWKKAKTFFGDGAQLAVYFAPSGGPTSTGAPMVTRYAFEAAPGGTHLRMESIEGFELVILPALVFAYDDLAERFGF